MEIGRRQPVRLIAVGGTIVMSGERAVPALDAAARVALLCCLGAGLTREQIAQAVAPWDAA